MYQIVHGSHQNLPDAAAFIKTLSDNDIFFEKNREIYVARAPGRLDAMGGIADYSGSLVLQMPIREAALVALQKDETRRLKISSAGAAENNRTSFFEMPLDDFERGGKPISYDEARKLFRGGTSWAAYIAGAVLVLMREKNRHFAHGARILIDSQVPEGKGVSSSAAIEAAALSAIAAAFAIELTVRESALLCQKVENLIVGAPCGVMDQMAAFGGAENQLMQMICQPAELLEPLEIPAEIGFWGIDSGVRHSVGAGDYGSVRTGAFIGYRLIADLAGLKINETETAGQVAIEDEKWRGFLANITPAEFEKHYAAHLPKEISGADFLARYQGFTDSVTKISPEKTYSVFNPTAHPIYENARVQRFAELLKQPSSESNRRELGALMFESHASYTACGLGSAGTDLLVEIARRSKDIYGAKITGGGSGGTVAVLGKRGAEAEIDKIAAEYERETNHRPFIFSGSSTGAAAFGHLRLHQ